MAKSQLTLLTEAVEKLINHPVAPVAPVLPIAPIAPIAPLLSHNPEDHNLLIRLDEKVDGIILQIQQINDGTSSKITNLELNKLDTKDSYPVLYRAGVEKRLDDMEKKSGEQGTAITRLIAYGTALIFVVGLIEFFVSNFYNK